MSHNPRDPKTLLKSNALAARKRYGQNFLIDENILQKIAHSAPIDKKTLVVEIGPGLGALTRYLLAQALAVLAYEIDEGLVKLLNKHFTQQHFHLIHDDVLKRNIDQDIAALNIAYDQVVLVANLPYYITTAVLMQCLEQTKSLTHLSVLMQYEVAQRITAKPSTKAYNALSVIIAYRANAKVAFKVPASVFVPAPKVDSALVTLTIQPSKHTPKDEAFFFALVKAAFKQRRKTLLNNLAEFIEVPKAEIANWLKTLTINPNARAETLEVDTFIQIADKVYEHLQ